MLRRFTATIKEGFDRAARKVWASRAADVRALLVIRKARVHGGAVILFTT